MGRYALASGVVFPIIATWQLTLWASVIACVVAALFAVGPFRTSRGAT
jgi:hypothetical protein